MDRVRNSREDKLCSVSEAIGMICDGNTIACSGFVGAGHPEALTAELERRFLESGSPQNLTIAYAAGQGDGKSRGLNHVAHKKLIRRVVGGHWALAPGLGKLASEGEIEAYNFPQGVMCQLYRDIAAGRPGCITHIGLDTFIDPALQGGRLNQNSPESLVERIELGGKTWLWYKSFPINIGFIRATAADPLGNLVMDKEAMIGDVLPISQAVHNCGGIVIAQVEHLVDEPVNPQHVRVPGILVDRIIIADTHEHHQTYGEVYNCDYCLPHKCGQKIGADLGRLAMDERRIIAIRACDEVGENAVANLGIGMPEGIARIAAERGILHKLILTVESGPIGGMPAGGLSFGASMHPDAIIDQPSQFDFYDGGGLDFAALGAAQIDSCGNVNVSKFGPRLAGVGGFVNITQTAKRLVFCGTFTASGLEIAVENGILRIVKEGTVRKFREQVEQISFSAKRAKSVGQEVLYVTERAVFRLIDGGLELVEVAPGIDIQEQIVKLMDFVPVMKNVKKMAEHCFK
ncbi:MAG: acyl CoA:acetate/3-ketoacid CoA transferase [Planctomycetes bacterium GWF2_50_10]|nr:MAG: acyl CoA:acetate/3-ketoacid CoA transferase [Planctomycetes bacterium GWF2_50_10]